jgi:hypothetical protein
VLHAGGNGCVTIARRYGTTWTESAVPVAELAYVVRQLRGATDVYMTQNRFWGFRRLVTRLAELDALFVDLDFYRMLPAETHPHHVLDLAIAALEDAQIPMPSFALSTGRGLALVWLHTPLPKAPVRHFAAAGRRSPGHRRGPCSSPGRHVQQPDRAPGQGTDLGGSGLGLRLPG